MTDKSMLDCFESLWHYGGQPSTSLSTASSATTTPPPNPTDRISCRSTPCSVMDEGVIARQAGSLHCLFAVMDEDGDGRLSLREMSSLLAKLGINTHSDNLSSLFQYSTLNSNEHQQISSTRDLPSLDFPQFAQLYASLFSIAPTQDGPTQTPVDDDDSFEDELLDAFQVYDTNRDGFISAAELAAVLRGLGLLPAGGHHGGIDAHLGTCQAYVDSVDLDGNGMVDLQEFKAMMKIHSSPPSCTGRHSCSSMLGQCGSNKAVGLSVTCKT